jgi:hypothetical protein
MEDDAKAVEDDVMEIIPDGAVDCQLRESMNVLKLLGADIGLSLVILVDGEGAASANDQVQEEEIKAWWSVSKLVFVGKPFNEHMVPCV